jgi:hypothetical protein
MAFVFHPSSATAQTKKRTQLNTLLFLGTLALIAKLSR